MRSVGQPAGRSAAHWGEHAADDAVLVARITVHGAVDTGRPKYRSWRRDRLHGDGRRRAVEARRAVAVQAVCSRGEVVHPTRGCVASGSSGKHDKGKATRVDST